MCGGNKTNQTTSSTAALPEYASAYSSLLKQAQNVASAQWNPATGQQVAGFTPTQNQAFDAVQNNQGSYLPSLSAAGASVAAGASPVSTSSILSAYNPFIESQVAALQGDLAHQNAQTLQASNSNAARIGALTGDRSQIAAQIAQDANNRNAALATSQLQSNAYGQAANIAQGNQQAALQGANIYGNLAGQTQQLGLNDINSLWGAGQSQQQQEQNVLNANTANAQAEAAYPFNTTQWLTGVATGLGNAAGANSSTTTPGPNLWSQLLGVGVAGLGAIGGKAFGGRVGYDTGGVVTAPLSAMPYAGALSYVPTIAINGGGRPAAPPNTAGQMQDTGMADVLSNYKQARSAFQGGRNAGSALDWATGTTRDTSAGSISGDASKGYWYVPGFATATTPNVGLGAVRNYINDAVGYADGGHVRRGYDAGGSVSDLADDGTGVYSSEPSLINFGEGLSRSFPFSENIDPASPWVTTVTPERTASNDVPQQAGLGETPLLQPASGAPPPVALGELNGSSQALPVPNYAASPETDALLSGKMPESEGLFGLRLSEPVRQGLIAAGLGMMASKSPFIGTAIGEGGLAGFKTYGEAKQQIVDNAQAKQKINMEAQRLMQSAREATQRLKYEGQRTAFEGQRTASDVALQGLQRQEIQQTLSQKRALLTAMQGDPSFLDRFKGTPFEAVARAAAAAGDLNALAGIVEKMQPKVSGTTFINPASNVATDTMSGTSYDMQTGRMLPPKMEGSNEESGQSTVVDPTQYGLPAGTPVGDYFASLPDAYRRKLVNIYTGQDTLAGASRGNAATLMRMQMDVQRAFPDYQPVDAQNRSTIMHSLADTKSPTSLYNQRKTLGTFAEHLAAPDGALQAAKDLPNGSVLAWNAARNEFNNQTGDSRMTALNTRLHFLQGELGKMVTNNVLTDREATALENQVSSASSPAQLRAAFDAYYALIKGRVESVDNASSSAMGSVYDPAKHSVATKQTRDLFEKYERDPWGKPIPGNAARHLRADPSASNRKDFDALFGAGASARVLGGN